MLFLKVCNHLETVSQDLDVKALQTYWVYVIDLTVFGRLGRLEGRLFGHLVRSK